MQNIAKTINKYITQNVDDLLIIYNDQFPSDVQEGIISIHDPATRKVADYIDGSAEYFLNISYSARYENSLTARTKLDSILTLLDGLKLVDVADNLELKISTVANVQFIGTDDKNNSIYTCSVSVTYKTSDF